MLRVGNLDAERDFSDVRDVVAAHLALLERGERGSAYNICSGQALRIGALLELLIVARACKPRVEVDPERCAPAAARRELARRRRDAACARWAGGRATRSADTLDALLERYRASA